jgi:multidrug resistance protein, MATE family
MQYYKTFIRKPYHTFFVLALPILFSLIAEPLTGMIDTAFIARLGAEELAALGVGTTVLSSFFWVFGFLGIGAQTEISQALGAKNMKQAKTTASLTLMLGMMVGTVILIAGIGFSQPIAELMGAEGKVLLLSDNYMFYRFLGAPAILLSFTEFGIFRGMMDMKSPLWLALGINGLNILLDALLIFGLGPIPALGVSGAALASSVSQWLGALVGLWIIWRKLGFTCRVDFKTIQRLMVIGSNMFIRTGLLTLFLLLTTRSATKIGPENGAAHQAVRQTWLLAALWLDAFAVAAQSLVAFYIGSGKRKLAKRAAFYSCLLSFYSGVVIAAMMWISESALSYLLVPASAAELFSAIWLISCLSQPINALAFASDGIHWGTSDFSYLRNVMILASLIGGLLLFNINLQSPNALFQVWLCIAVWCGLRSLFGILRIWPGIGKSPFVAVRQPKDR